jgi:hypothetical protein
MVGVAALVWAAPVAAQERGTIEFGAFASAASFDRALSLTTAFGAGGRVGVYLVPRWSMEFEKAEMRASRPDGLKDVNVGILSGRLVTVPFRWRAASFLVGGGAGVSTETNFMHTYGVDALVGMKLPLNQNAAFRIDGVWDFLANEDWKTYRSVRLGISMYRHPLGTRSLTAAPAKPAPAPDVATKQ